MAFTQFTEDMEVISKLSDTPNVDDGLTAAQLKAKFDQAPRAIKTYINNVLLQEAAEKPSFSGVVKASGGKYVAATAGTDYQSPLGSGDITTDMMAADAVAPYAAQLQTARTITIQDSSGSFVSAGVSFDGSGNIVLTLPDSVSLAKLIAGSSLVGTSYPASPVEGQIFFLEEE